MPAQTVAEISHYEVEIYQKSNPKGALAGNEVADCMPLGSGKDNVYKTYPFVQLTVRYQTKEGHWVTLCQTVVYKSKNIGSGEYSIENSLDTAPPLEILDEAGTHLQLDNLEVNHNFRVDEQLDVVRALLEDFFLNIRPDMHKNTGMNRKEVIIGEKYTPSGLFERKAIRTVPLILPTYSDAENDHVYLMSPRVAGSCEKQVEELPDNPSLQNPPLGIANIRPLSHWDSIAMAVIEAEANQDNPDKLEHLPALQNRLIASIIANELRGKTNLSVRLGSPNANRMQGYLLAYETWEGSWGVCSVVR